MSKKKYINISKNHLHKKLYAAKKSLNIKYTELQIRKIWKSFFWHNSVKSVQCKMIRYTSVYAGFIVIIVTFCILKDKITVSITVKIKSLLMDPEKITLGEPWIFQTGCFLILTAEPSKYSSRISGQSSHWPHSIVTNKIVGQIPIPILLYWTERPLNALYRSNYRFHSTRATI